MKDEWIDPQSPPLDSSKKGEPIFHSSDIYDSIEKTYRYLWDACIKGAQVTFPDTRNGGRIEEATEAAKDALFNLLNTLGSYGDDWAADQVLQRSLGQGMTAWTPPTP